MTPQKFVIAQEQRKFSTAQWSNRVRATTDLRVAVQEAARPPVPGHLIRVLHVLWKPDDARARRAVEAHLIALLNRSHAGGSIEAHRSLLPRLAGHWPQACQKMRRLLQS
mgnify:CR=1 FL=1